MDTASQQLHRLVFEALLVPGLLSFALVIALSFLRREFQNLSRWWLYGFVVIAFFCITCLPHAWLIFFPEPCVIRFTSPTNMCDYSAFSHLQMGLFAGGIGALMARLALIIWDRFART
ncbi:hypothetical protein [Pseudomonas batumici]|uniref:hypothetical protein n=1 Tax=Pseudomonas batumici TaxID=226910 RepID=UPI000589E4F7|nr:hypothetical protein [Pseudomonas batumici]